jgi:hypothetical protein
MAKNCEFLPPNEIAVYSFRQALYIPAKALAARLLPNDLKGGTVW